MLSYAKIFKCHKNIYIYIIQQIAVNSRVVKALDSEPAALGHGFETGLRHLIDRRHISK